MPATASAGGADASERQARQKQRGRLWNSGGLKGLIALRLEAYLCLGTVKAIDSIPVELRRHHESHTRRRPELNGRTHAATDHVGIDEVVVGVRDTASQADAIRSNIIERPLALDASYSSTNSPAVCLVIEELNG